MQKRTMKRWFAIGMLFVVGLLTTSCLSALFNQRPEPAIAIAEGSPYGPAPLTVAFDISGSSDPDGEIVSFTFDFGDGSEPVEGTEISELIEHTYDEPGNYLAKLTLTDNHGATASIMAAIGVYEPAEE